jgi:hypothetical protein
MATINVFSKEKVGINDTPGVNIQVGKVKAVKV